MKDTPKRKTQCKWCDSTEKITVWGICLKCLNKARCGTRSRSIVPKIRKRRKKK
jgi:hypothetical protein